MKIGILGGGQLARMLALAGYPLAQRFVILDPSGDAGAVGLGQHLQGAFDDPALLSALATEADVVTYEFENVPADVAGYLAQHTKIYPPAKALEVSQDRLAEKNFFQSLNITTAGYRKIDDLTDLRQAMATVGYPAILKSRRLGYDGKGQTQIQSEQDLSPAWETMQGVPSIVEQRIPFDREISIIAARNPSGATVFYPISENYHQGGILRVAKCCTNDPAQAAAEALAHRILQALDYVGVIAVEMFQANGELIANEFAPRVHNSGHWTIEGAQTSQFENHIRAIMNLPLGKTDAVGHSAMVNFIGNIPSLKDVLEIPQVHMHLYDKSPRQGRKLAHATIRCACPDEFNEALARLTRLADSYCAL